MQFLMKSINSEMKSNNLKLGVVRVGVVVVMVVKKLNGGDGNGGGHHGHKKN